MAKREIVKEPVKGGWIGRDSRSGRFVSVETEKGTSFVTRETRKTIEEIAARRDAAMRRLANR